MCKVAFRYLLYYWEPPVQQQQQQQPRIRMFLRLWLVGLELTKLNYRILLSGYFMYKKLQGNK